MQYFLQTSTENATSVPRSASVPLLGPQLVHIVRGRISVAAQFLQRSTGKPIAMRKRRQHLPQIYVVQILYTQFLWKEAACCGLLVLDQYLPIG